MNDIGSRETETGARPALVPIALLVLSAIAGCSTADPELKAAVAKQEMCSACHGPNGRSVSVAAPLLAGEPKAYLIAQLTALRDHSRADDDARTFMWPMAASLSDASIDALAAYFSEVPTPPPTAVFDAQMTDAKAIFEKGAADRGIAPCSSCHGDKAQGMAAFPRLAGQHADYLAAQLAAFANGSRANPIMGPMAKNLTAKEARSIAAYLATL